MSLPKVFLCKSSFIKSRCLTYLQFKRLFSVEASNHDILKSKLGLQPHRFQRYINKNKLNEMPLEDLLKVVTFCEEHNYTKEEILANPAVFRIKVSTLDQHYNVMTEGGFNNISLTTLTKFRSICRRNIEDLKQLGYIDRKLDVAASFITYLNPCPKGFSVNRVFNLWSDVHFQVLNEYLKWRLETTDEKIAKMIDTHPTVRRKSFKYLCENISFAKEIGFTHEKILKNGYILYAYPKFTQEIIEKYPEIAGVPIRRIIRMYPKLMATSPFNIQKIIEILKKHKIPDEALAKRFNVFYLSPETVDFRLRELKRVNDFKVLLHNPKILTLVLHHNRAKSRLQFLKNLHLKCATIKILGTDDNKFDSHIREGRDENNLTDTYSFLRGIFKINVNDFESTIKKHPFYLQVPLTTMEESYDFLIGENFSNKAIFQVIYIILYPKEKLQKSLLEITQFEKQTGRLLTQVNKLNLALYFIEKEHHFTGDGVWTKTSEESIDSS